MLTVEQFIVSVVSCKCNASVSGAICWAQLIPKAPHPVHSSVYGYFLVSQLGPDYPLPQAGFTYKFIAVTTPDVHWEILPVKPTGSVVSFEVLASTDEMERMTNIANSRIFQVTWEQALMVADNHDDNGCL